MKRTCWDTRATDSIIKSGQKDTEASIKVILRQYDLLEHVEQDNNLIIICHYSVCAIENQLANYKVVFLI